MKTTVGEMKKMLEPVPNDFEIRVVIPCKVGHEFIEVEKNLITTMRAASRKLVVIETDILDLGPK